MFYNIIDCCGRLQLDSLSPNRFPEVLFIIIEDPLAELFFGTESVLYGFVCANLFPLSWIVRLSSRVLPGCESYRIHRQIDGLADEICIPPFPDQYAHYGISFHFIICCLELDQYEWFCVSTPSLLAVHPCTFPRVFVVLQGVLVRALDDVRSSIR